jgi:MYXO-CTERM domain-containing protein
MVAMKSPHLLRRSFALSFGLCVLAIPLTASAQNYIDLPGTQPGGLNNAVPLDGATPCGVTCHFSRDPMMTVPSMTTTAMPYDGWVGSMMGNATRDPLFLAALTVAEQDAPGVGDWCLRCHTPPGFVGGRTRGTPTAARGAMLMPSDREGVSCDACHRMVATTNIRNAQYQFSPTETRFGPYPSSESIRHPSEASAWMADSRMCGVCHEVSNPLAHQRTAAGMDTGRAFPLDTSYSEWEHSDYGTSGSPDARSCQDCHMPRLGMPARVSSNKVAMIRTNPRRHDLVGANSWGSRAMAFLRNEVASGEFYDPDIVPFYENSAQRAEEMLRTAVRLEIREAPQQSTPGARVSITARLTNLSGHRFPTGYADGRRAWLEVALLDADNRVTVVSGAYDEAMAHLDESSPDLRVYEAFHGRAGMGRGEHIALHDTVVKDTRLPPKGYRPQAGHEPVGADYAGGANGALRHWDDAQYSFTIPANARGPVTVRVRARYQITTREYVDFLARENRTDDRGRELQRIYNATGRAAPMNAAEATTMITLPAGRPDGGVASDTGTSTQPGDPGCNCRAAGASPTRGGAPFAALAAALAALVTRRRRRAPTA